MRALVFCLLAPIAVLLVMQRESAVAQTPAELEAVKLCLQATVTADPNQTIAYCSAAIGAERPLKPGAGHLYLFRGRALAIAGEQEKALADLDIAVLLDPADGDIHYWRAETLSKLGRIDEAVTAVGHAFSCAGSTIQRANAAMLQGKLRGYADDSLTALTRAYYLTRFAISEYNREPIAAEQHLARLALSGVSSPALREAHYAVGGLYMDVGDHASALRMYEKAIACAPFDAKLYSARLYGNYEVGRLDFAMVDAETVLVRMPRHGWALSDRCLLKGMMGRYEEALTDCEAALLVPNTVRAATLGNRAVMLFHLGRLAEARASFDEVLSTMPTYPYALYGRGVLKLRAGDDTGHADIANAKRAYPRVEVEYKRWKMQP
jgi:tetratricopeptide (TPR) repeat protein